MKKALRLCLMMCFLTMPSIVKAENNVNHQHDILQQDSYKQDKQQDQQDQEKLLREKRKRDQQEQDKQLRDKQQRDQQERDKQLRDKQQRDQQERDKQLRDKQQRDQQERDKQLRDKHQREQQERDNQHNWQSDRRQQNGHHNWSHPTYRHENWQQTEHRSHGAMPFKWHQRFDRYSPDYQMEPIHHREWNDRFPGLHLYKWMDRRGEGFWYRDQRIVDAIMFYDDSDELVSMGFFHDGIFIMIRDDDQYYENHESFFLSWWNRNGRISISL